ncbi:hypothetical protein [Virgibacillus dokdonensis]|uniref:hypothetical protein n=1 Tax=Virgibacillus dokdonensis TaxID=302167 RepID=UPI003F5DBF0A
MFSDIMWGSLAMILIIAIYVTIQKRKRAGVKGIKSALTPICFFCISIVNIIAYFFEFLGLVSFGITVALFILGAYFTKYLKIPAN